MDPITHYMLAYTLGRNINIKKPQLKALTLSAILLDIDVFTIILGWNFVLNFHGTIVHSFTIAIILSIILSMIFHIYYKKNVFVYALIGVFMHLLLDFIQTSFPKWRHDMVLLFPFSKEEFALRYFIPFPTIIGLIMVSSLFLFSLFLLYRYVKMGEYPWRLWIDERRGIKLIKMLKGK